MHKYTVLVTIFLFLGNCVCGFAQTGLDYKKIEYFIGYSFTQSDTNYAPKFRNASELVSGYTDRASYHGFNASAVYNLRRYLGIKADVSGTYSLYTPTLTIIDAAMADFRFVTGPCGTRNSLAPFYCGKGVVVE